MKEAKLPPLMARGPRPAKKKVRRAVRSAVWSVSPPSSVPFVEYSFPTTNQSVKNFENTVRLRISDSLIAVFPSQHHPPAVINNPPTHKPPLGRGSTNPLIITKTTKDSQKPLKIFSANLAFDWVGLNHGEPPTHSHKTPPTNQGWGQGQMNASSAF